MQFIRRADASEDAVGDSNGGAVRGNKGASVSQNDNERILPDLGAFSSHVWTRDQCKRGLVHLASWTKQRAVRN